MPFIGELAAIGTSLCFSFGSTMFTLAGRELGSLLVNRARLLVAVLVVILLHTLTFGQPFPLDAGAERWFWLGLSGFVGLALGVWLSLVAVQNTNVGVASTLSSLMPIFLIPISYVMFKERVTRQAIVGTLITFVGMVILFV